ncbi:hypothetical protein H5410_045542 [Solanum commersonii]|uniref:Uncharacterized protein n=1 Tax=Solanum commersonii TaxID=4109 RepID=A0A9J5XD20_SOLCO|nr:hypothetical protein H5410_045542 [Solanum commersonii]
MGTINIFFTHVKDEESSIPTSNCLENGNLQFFKDKENCLQKLIVKKCVAKDHSSQLVGIADPPFGLVHRLSALSFNNFKFCNIGQWSTALWNLQIVDLSTLKFSSAEMICDSPLPKNLKLTILASNASLSLTKVFKCPHKKNDSIFTQWFNQLKFQNQDQHLHSQR